MEVCVVGVEGVMKGLGMGLEWHFGYVDGMGLTGVFVYTLLLQPPNISSYRHMTGIDVKGVSLILVYNFPSIANAT